MTHLLALAALATAPAAEPVRTDVFRPGNGYVTCRIPGLVVTAKGTLLAYCESRKSARGDWGQIDIQLRRSTDGGATWSEPVTLGRKPADFAKNPVALAQKLAKPDEVTFNNAVAIADRSGAVHFLYCIDYARCFSMRSDDDGKTFTEPVEITSPTFAAFRPGYDWKVLATGPGHGIQLKSGRLVVPVWLSTGTGGHAHRPSVTSTIFSDDGGKTWKRGAIAVPNTKEWVNPNETVAAELSDGRVMLNVRSESPNHRRLVVTSPDGTGDWGKPSFDETLYEPICMASLLSLGGGRLVFTNPDSKPTTPEGKPRERRNLTVRLSGDDGKTWSASRVIDAGPSGYSDLAAGRDGALYCLYERAGGLTLVRFDAAWVEGGQR
jgi:sialidase-1